MIQSHHELCIVHCPVRIAGIDGAAQHVYELQTECLVFKRHCAVIISSDAVVGYGGPVRIPGKTAYSIASAVEGLLYKWQPSFFKERIDEGLPHIFYRHRDSAEFLSHI